MHRCSESCGTAATPRVTSSASRQAAWARSGSPRSSCGLHPTSRAAAGSRGSPRSALRPLRSCQREESIAPDQPGIKSLVKISYEYRLFQCLFRKNRRILISGVGAPSFRRHLHRHAERRLRALGQRACLPHRLAAGPAGAEPLGVEVNRDATPQATTRRPRTPFEGADPRPGNRPEAPRESEREIRYSRWTGG